MDQLRALGLKRASCSVFASDNMAAESHFYAYHRYNEFAQGIRLVLRAPSHGLDAGPGWKAAGAVVGHFAATDAYLDEQRLNGIGGTVLPASFSADVPASVRNSCPYYA